MNTILGYALVVAFSSVVYFTVNALIIQPELQQFSATMSTLASAIGDH